MTKSVTWLSPKQNPTLNLNPKRHLTKPETKRSKMTQSITWLNPKHTHRVWPQQDTHRVWPREDTHLVLHILCALKRSHKMTQSITLTFSGQSDGQSWPVQVKVMVKVDLFRSKWWSSLWPFHVKLTSLWPFQVKWTFHLFRWSESWLKASPLSFHLKT